MFLKFHFASARQTTDSTITTTTTEITTTTASTLQLQPLLQLQLTPQLPLQQHLRLQQLKYLGQVRFSSLSTHHNVSNGQETVQRAVLKQPYYNYYISHLSRHSLFLGAKILLCIYLLTKLELQTTSRPLPAVFCYSHPLPSLPLTSLSKTHPLGLYWITLFKCYIVKPLFFYNTFYIIYLQCYPLLPHGQYGLTLSLLTPCFEDDYQPLFYLILCGYSDFDFFTDSPGVFSNSSQTNMEIIIGISIYGLGLKIIDVDQGSILKLIIGLELRINMGLGALNWCWQSGLGQGIEDQDEDLGLSGFRHNMLSIQVLIEIRIMIKTKNGSVYLLKFQIFSHGISTQTPRKVLKMQDREILLE